MLRGFRRQTLRFLAGAAAVAVVHGTAVTVSPRAAVASSAASPASMVSRTSPTSRASQALQAPSPNPFRTGRTLIIPHAGGDALFPENTLYAYERSMALGGEVVDIDVQLSADGVPVAFHDGTLQRITGVVGRVTSSTVAELERLDAGWGFSKGGKHPFRGKGLRIPTVEAVLKKFPRALTTLDLKDQRVAVVAPVCALLRRLGRTNDVYVGIDAGAQVLEFRKRCPEVQTSGTDAERRAARAARESGDRSFRWKQLVSQPRYHADDGTIRITKEVLDFAHRNGTAVLTWVVDDPKHMETLMRLGVDGIYTRRPDVAVKVRSRLSG